jgi:hypothetical protein
MGGDGVDLFNGFGDDGTASAIERDNLSGGSGGNRFILSFNFGFGSIGYNDFGSLDFATLQDFNSGEGDRILVGGNSVLEYSLDKTQSVGGIGGSAIDTQIFRGLELIAVVQDTTNVSLTDFVLF